MTRVALIDPYSGASGDMFLGALLDLGFAEEELRRGLAGIDLDPHELEITSAGSHGVGGTRCRVVVHHEVHDRTWRDIRGLIDQSALPEEVRAPVLRVFGMLAAAEAAVHGVPVEDVHFHEVGGTDAIIDIVGTCLGFHALGVTDVVSRPVQVGHGFVRAAHGVLPVPAPATARVLADGGIPIAAPTPEHLGQAGELLTPTGAALIAGLATFNVPEMVTERVGYGFGTRELPWPNALRVWLGTAEASPLASGEPSDDAAEWLIETNIDDMNPQFTGLLVERLFAAGAVDAWVTPIQMKKNRPAMTVSAICDRASREAVVATFIEQSTTLGVRMQEIVRAKAERRLVTVTTRWGEVPVKLRGWRGRVLDAMPEYDACAAIAIASEVPVRDVWNEAHRMSEVYFGQKWEHAPGDRVTAMRKQR